MLWLIAFLLTALPAYTVPVRPANAQRPVLVEEHPKLVFRTAAMLAKTYVGDSRGLDKLWVSGSAQFNSVSLNEIKACLPVAEVVVLDLRQESHALVNDRLVSWQADDHWPEVGASHDEALEAEWERIRDLRQIGTVGLVDIRQFDNGEGSTGEATRVIRVVNEEDLVNSSDFDYERLTVSDHLRPDDEEVDRFLCLVEGLSSEQWLHIHCSDGLGRTATYMAMFDMLHNADKVTFKDILARQSALTPGYSLDEINYSQPRDYHRYYAERYEFLKWFYRYAQARLQGHVQSWSQWLKTAS